MAKAKVESLKKHTLNLREGDMEALALLFPRYQPSVMVRRIVSKFIDKANDVETNDPDLDNINL